MNASVGFLVHLSWINFGVVPPQYTWRTDPCNWAEAGDAYTRTRYCNGQPHISVEEQRRFHREPRWTVLGGRNHREDPLRACYPHREEDKSGGSSDRWGVCTRRVNPWSGDPRRVCKSVSAIKPYCGFWYWWSPIRGLMRFIKMISRESKNEDDVQVVDVLVTKDGQT